MTAICTLENISLIFGDTPIFHKVSLELPIGITGLVAPNGSGKSTLLSVLHGQASVTGGKVSWRRRHHLVKQLNPRLDLRIVDCLADGHLYEVFLRVEQGHASEDDLISVADYWHLPLTWQRQLEEAKINAPLDTPIERLSGGQRAKLSLAYAFSLSSDYLLLDEPSNHLDQSGREWLQEKILNHAGGALVASHDVELLENVRQIIEIYQRGLKTYGGAYSAYMQQKESEQAALLQRAEDNRKEFNQLNNVRQKSLHNFATRQRQGKGKRNSQSKSLMDSQKDRAGKGLGKLKRKLEQRQLQLEKKREEISKITVIESQRLRPQKLSLTKCDSRKSIQLHLENLQLPYGSHDKPISLTVRKGERWRIAGGNGSGKSTLLKVIAGQLKALSGVCQTRGSLCYLDQGFSFLNKELSALENLFYLHPGRKESEWRTMLGSLRLRGDTPLLPLRLLSGGEQLKVALLAVTRGTIATDLILLDEPDNHLDLDSRQLLVNAIMDFSGAVLLVSHDLSFINAIGVDSQLNLD
ncbi:ATP-binding cassette domain-containing protein [Microbulbifer variabilis]|uniref:ATP-binding cassette domain-containing protein n=1 Tax=Microbulbifer variabilis TaxID=266805 RepID=A0ABY4VA65_9GAMM|nr:ATP-binding cassette domain-containing protein [Microbulbifer variabilis]USD20078.1 ATP-binding cassette domain-containing protein [Microbulbifer variabilis]